MSFTQEYLKRLCDAYHADQVDRRTFIRERRRLIDESVAGQASAPPAVPADFDPNDSIIDLDSTVRLPRPPGSEA